MGKVKEDLLKIIQALPDDCTMEDVYYHLYVREKVQRGMADMEAGRVVSQEEAERRFAEWAESSGPKPQ